MGCIANASLPNFTDKPFLQPPTVPTYIESSSKNKTCFDVDD